MNFLYILIAIVVFPIFTFIGVMYSTPYFSEETFGSVDGWLSYLGGYSGGILAFFSAYLIFKKDQDAKNKTWVYVRPHCSNLQNIKSIEHCLIFESKNDASTFDQTERMFVSKGLYPLTIISFQNVSDNFAKKVSFSLDKRFSGNIFPFLHHIGREDILTVNHLGDLNKDQSFSFVLHIDPALYENKDYLDFKLTYMNLSNQQSRQKIRLHLNKVNHAWDFESQT